MSAHDPGAPRRASQRSLFSTLREDLIEVVSDVHRRGVGRAVGGTLSSLETFYLTEEERQRLADMPALKRFFRRIWWFIRGLLMKLTPARRILLALSLWFMIVGVQHIQVRPLQVSVRFPFIGVFLLFTVFILELKDKLTARDELEAGRKVQLALMPSESPRIPGWDVWLYTQPANDVGGDLVDHLPLTDERHAVALGDVAGKALPAALLSVKLQATIRALAPQFDSLADLGAATNRILQRDGLPTRFASLVYVTLDAASGRVRLLNCGHMPPLLVRPSGVTLLDRGGVVLGIMPEATYAEQYLDVGIDDVLLVYSDGVSEAMNEAGDFFGDERLHAAAHPAGVLASRTIGLRVLDAVRRFIGEAPPNDDISLMVLRRMS